MIALLVGAAAAGAWPGDCASDDGTSYLVLFAAFLGTYALHLALDLALISQRQGGMLVHRWQAGVH